MTLHGRNPFSKRALSGRPKIVGGQSGRIPPGILLEDDSFWVCSQQTRGKIPRQCVARLFPTKVGLRGRLWNRTGNANRNRRKLSRNQTQTRNCCLGTQAGTRTPLISNTVLTHRKSRPIPDPQPPPLKLY